MSTTLNIHFTVYNPGLTLCQELTDTLIFAGKESQLSTRPDSGWGGCDCRVWVNSWKTKHGCDFDLIIAACLWKRHCADSPREK